MDPALLREREAFKKKALATPRYAFATYLDTGTGRLVSPRQSTSQLLSLPRTRTLASQNIDEELKASFRQELLGRY